MKFATIFTLATTLSFASLALTRGMSEQGMRSMSEKRRYWSEKAAAGKYPNKELKSALHAAQTCPEGGGSVSINGEAFPCNRIDFESFIPLNELFINHRSGTTIAADIWGWYNAAEDKEITLLCVDNGMWFIDTTVSTAPVRLGFIKTGRPQDSWCDIKVYKDVAYIVKDDQVSGSPATYGIEVFDLKRLIGVTGANGPQEFTPDFVYTGHGRAHNLVVDTESGFLYSVGSNTCSGGLHMINLEPNPLNPTRVGCVSGDGYTHDAQCVVYKGPDTRYTGKQICFAYNEDTLTIWDVTVKTAVTRLSRTTYPTARYTHQGWLTQDMKWVILNDELDESRGAVSRTTTYLVDVSNLNAPVFGKKFTHPEVSIDHNLYVWGAIHENGWGGNPPLGNPPSSKFAYLSNYVAGIKVLDIEDMENVKEAGKFDVAPDISGNVFEGTWSNYMHPSGLLAVSSIDRGFFLLRPQMAFEFPAETSPPSKSPTLPPAQSQAPTSSPTKFPTTGCADLVPSGLHFSDGSPAECVNIKSYCTSNASVRDRCPATCGLCPGACEDKVPSGLTYSNGSPAPCSDFVGNEDFYCGNYAVVRDACPKTCDLCTSSTFALFKGLAEIDEPLSNPVGTAQKPTEKLFSEAVLVGAIGVLAFFVFALASTLVVITRRNLSAAREAERSILENEADSKKSTAVLAQQEL